jgi:hypothetical protein
VAQELSLGCDHINAWRHVGRLAGAAGEHDPGGHPEVAALIQTEAVAAAPLAEIEDEPLVGRLAILGDVEGSDLPVLDRATVAVDDVECLAIRRNRDPVGTLDLRLREDARHLAVGVDTVDGPGIIRARLRLYRESASVTGQVPDPE